MQRPAWSTRTSSSTRSFKRMYDDFDKAYGEPLERSYTKETSTGGALPGAPPSIARRCGPCG